MTHIPRNVLLPYLQALREQIATLHPAAADDEQLFVDTLDGETDTLTVLRTIIRRAIEVEGMREVLGNRVRELRTRRERFEQEAEAYRITVRDALEALGLKRLEDAEFTASIKAGRASVVITDAEALPKEMLRVTVAPNKEDIALALRNGKKVPGAMLNNGPPVLAISRS